MFLSLLTKEEKFYFIDLLTNVVRVDGEMTETEKQLIKRLKYEMGDEIQRYHHGNLNLEKLINYFSEKSKTVRNLVYMNLIHVTLFDEFYSVEDHFLLEEIKQRLLITDKKKNELMKLVYAERDLREKTRRAITE